MPSGFGTSDLAAIRQLRPPDGRGVARAGLEGAPAQIATAGGGLVEAISEVTAGREAQGRFLFSATAELFEQYGFTKGRQVGKHA